MLRAVRALASSQRWGPAFNLARKHSRARTHRTPTAHAAQSFSSLAATGASMPSLEANQTVSHPAGQTIVYDRLPARADASPGQPALVFLNGLLSDRSGRKAQAILEQGRELGAETVLLDYRAHGESPGDFQSLGPGDWLQDALLVLDKVVTQEREVLVGSSLGGWIALLVARARPHRVHALVLIAPAVDISEHHWASLPEPVRLHSLHTGLIPLESPYVSTPMPTTTPQDNQQVHNTAGPTQQPTNGLDSTPMPMTTPQNKRQTRDDTQDTPTQHADDRHLGSNSARGSSQAAIEGPVTVSHAPGAVMLGLSFFTQGAELLCVPHDSTFMSEYAGYAKQAGATAGLAKSTAVPALVGLREALTHASVYVLHGDVDDCVPYSISKQLMSYISNGAPTSPRTCTQALDTPAGHPEPRVATGQSLGAQGPFVRRAVPRDGSNVASADECAYFTYECGGVASGGAKRVLYQVCGGDHRLSSASELALLHDVIGSAMC